MNIAKETLLVDAKTGMKNKFDPDGKSKNSVDLLMHSWDYFLPKKDETDYESREFAKVIYFVIGWNGEKYFDVINSFYCTYFCGLVRFCDEKKIKCSNLSDDYKTWNENPFRIDFHLYMSIKGILGYYPVKKATLVKKMLDDTIYKRASDRMVREISPFKEFAALCHCVANFMPCPDWEFYRTKGLMDDVKDYLPLMVDKIQQCVQDESEMVYNYCKKDVVVSFGKIANWHKWLVDNREKYCLDPYYKVENGKITGIPLFKNQSLAYPIPMNADEVKECLKSIIERINVRADLILERYQLKL